MTQTNPIPPEIRKAVSTAVAAAETNSTLKLKPYATDTRAVIEATNIPAHVPTHLERAGYEFGWGRNRSDATFEILVRERV